LKTKEKTLIAVPNEIFRKIEKELPENIAKIDLPQNYISTKRLNEFKEKESFEEYEITALWKYLIWMQKTKTG
jgi:hypothetical protein